MYSWHVLGRRNFVSVNRYPGSPKLRRGWLSWVNLTVPAAEEPAPSFLHSALCAMSLPVRRPADEAAPIIRQDGQYTLAITPRPVLRPENGQQKLRVLGVPYGSLPRLILIHVMTQAVRSQSRQIALGSVKSGENVYRRGGQKVYRMAGA